MAKIDVKDLTGAVKGSIELSDEIFGIEPNEVAMSTVVRNQLANRRQGTQKTKTRSEVSGGGKRPYRQKGGPSGHGSMYHRRVGSMGATSTPGRVVPGKKMPGHMGAVNCTVQNLSVVMVDGDRGILVIRGAIPGPKGGIVTVQNTVKA